jgi:hypothetical protein
MGYKSVLLGTENRPNDRSSNDFGEFIRKNDMAYADLMMACEDDVCFDPVDNSRSKEFSDGNAN